MKPKASLEDQLEELTRELQRKNRALEIEAALEKVRSGQLVCEAAPNCLRLQRFYFNN